MQLVFLRQRSSFSSPPTLDQRQQLGSGASNIFSGDGPDRCGLAEKCCPRASLRQPAEGQTILVMGDPRTIVSWKYCSLRDGVDRLETDKGQVLEMSVNQWSLYADRKAVSNGKIEKPPATSPQ